MIKTNFPISPYHDSVLKKAFDFTSAFILLLLSSPITALIVFLLKAFNHGPILFSQHRVGLNGTVFKIIKFRTMVVCAEKLKNKYKNLNISDGPVFKIYNDPRLTKIGKILYKTGLDELPQLINVIKGEMSIVGPRPLPTYEAKNLNKKDKLRELVKPGITSEWVIKGSHEMKFKKWMELDRNYVQYGSLGKDVYIIVKTIAIGISSLIKTLILK